MVKESFSQSEIRTALLTPSEDRWRFLLHRLAYDSVGRGGESSSAPVVVAIELSGLCNLRCTFCFQSDPRLSQMSHLRLMDSKFAMRVIDQCADAGVASVVFASRGEPLLHPRAPELMGYARSRGIVDIKLNTNGTIMNADLAQRLLEADISTIVFSVDSANPEIYERLRRRGKFETILENIRTFNAAREAWEGSSRTRTRIHAVISDTDQDPDQDRAFWKGWADEFSIRWEFPRLGIYDQERPAQWTRPCSLLWERIYVWADGEVSPCDSDYLAQLPIGQFEPEDPGSLLDIWKGGPIEELRRIHEGGQRAKLTPCRACPGY